MSAVLYEVKDKIAYITLNRPDQLNAINGEMFDGLVSACKKCSADPDAWVAILSGKGRAFCTGADLRGLGSGRKAGDVEELYFSVLRMKKPLIAALQGYCLAQGEGIAFCCDIRVAAEGTKFGWPQVSRGITTVSGPSFGAHFLPRNIGLYLMYTAEMISADDLLRYNFLNKVVPEDRLFSECEEIAKKILKNAPLAVQGVKEAVIAGMEMNLQQRMKVAALVYDSVSTSEDTKEGLQAFAEKRKPVWKGR